jgi:hypothetical protein
MVLSKSGDEYYDVDGHQEACESAATEPWMVIEETREHD